MIENDELIRKGNALIAASRDGRLGITEARIQALQRCYTISRRGAKWLRWLLPAVLLIIGVFTFSYGVILDKAFYQSAKDNGFEMRTLVAANIRDDGPESMIFIGAFACLASVACAGFLMLILTKGKYYVTLVEQEYPKLTKKDAA